MNLKYQLNDEVGHIQWIKYQTEVQYRSINLSNTPIQIVFTGRL